MCGITGFIDLSGTCSGGELARTATAMADALVHRGPDMADVWVDEDAGIALGFRRLSIIDLSAAGAQPMVSASGRTVICYNGEIYNGDDLRARLGPDCPQLRGHSDTEILLEAAERFGSADWHRRVWRIAGPIMLSNVSTPLIGIVDTAVVGHLDHAYYIGAVAIGMIASGGVLLVFGSPGGYPDVGVVASALDQLGVRVDGLTLAQDQSWGTRRLMGAGQDGVPIEVKAYVPHLSEAAGSALKIGRDQVTLRDGDEVLHRVGDPVRVRVTGRDDKRKRWKLALMKA